jgi:DNA polymerase-3 subunit alpha
MGLTSLRNLGKSALPIVEEREANGSYTSFDDFVRRIMPDKRMFESLVYSGTLDEFEGSRASKIRTFEQIVNLKEALNKHKNMWFEIPELTEWYKSFYNISISNVPEMEKEDKLEKEYLYAGMYVSEHPLDQYVYITDSFPHSDIAELVEDNEEYDTEEIVKVEQSKQVTVVGIVKEFESKLTKKGDTMYVFKLEDTTGEIRTTVFPREVKEFGHIIRENAIVRIDGLWKNDDFGIQVVASNVVTLTEITPSTAKAYSVYANRTNIGDVLDILDKYSSKDKDAVRVEIVFGDKRFVAIDDRNLKKRAVKVEDSDNVSILKISPSLEAYSAIRKVTKIERK